mmetsp:Transcript_33823/g.43231  ORF Transcript_33823/g.43231 Transcript_33823/m.43231 type:complete len:207 (+) Transcript_33823:46-666(+)
MSIPITRQTKLQQLKLKLRSLTKVKKRAREKPSLGGSALASFLPSVYFSEEATLCHNKLQDTKAGAVVSFEASATDNNHDYTTPSRGRSSVKEPCPVFILQQFQDKKDPVERLIHKSRKVSSIQVKPNYTTNKQHFLNSCPATIRKRHLALSYSEQVSLSYKPRKSRGTFRQGRRQVKVFPTIDEGLAGKREAVAPSSQLRFPPEE